MILKAIISEEDKQVEVFEITNYYSEGEDYLEADIDLTGFKDRTIILSEGLYMEADEDWEEITILTDKGHELLKITKEDAE